MTGGEQTFYIDLLEAHEAAHQWWGNVVSPAGYRDNWLMEALANYSALLYLEKRDGRGAVDAALESYREDLLAKDEKGQTSESTGPIVLGARLESSQSPSRGIPSPTGKAHGSCTCCARLTAMSGSRHAGRAAAPV